MKTRTVVAAGILAVLAAFAACSAKQKAVPGAANVEAVPPGYRGVAIPLPASQIEFVRKGDRVDVFVTFEARMADNSKGKVTATVLQNILILDVRKPASLDGQGAVELVLNPTEAEYAALSLQQGAINLALRAQGDTQMSTMEMASFRKLFR